MFDKWKRWSLWSLILIGGLAYADITLSPGIEIWNQQRGSGSLSVGYSPDSLRDLHIFYEGHRGRSIGGLTYNIWPLRESDFKFNFGAAYWDGLIYDDIGTHWNFVLEPEYKINRNLSVLLTHYSHGAGFGIAKEKDNKGINLLKVRIRY